MFEKPGPKRRHAPRGFLGMLDRSKPRVEPELPSDEPAATREATSSPKGINEGLDKFRPELRQAIRLVRIARDSSNGWRRLAVTNPELAEQFREENRQHMLRRQASQDAAADHLID
jgi:hypothetical protein